jgi:hypothetical protein
LPSGGDTRVLKNAALAGLDRGEGITFPSAADKKLRDAYDEAPSRLFNATPNGTPAARYGLG